jgi:thioredoxin reductase
MSSPMQGPADRVAARPDLDRLYDVIIVGGGAAGLSGALALGRARRAVLVVDAGDPRNAPAGHVHNYLTSEAMAPDALLAAGRTEIAQYGVPVLDGTVTAAHPAAGQPGSLDDGPSQRFRLDLADGRSIRARRLLVTTGLVDELPEVPGVAARWGRDVVHCPYCHGWEVRDQPIGVLATGPLAAHQALIFRQLSSDVVLFSHTGPALSAEEAERLAARDIEIIEGEVSALEVHDDRLTGVRLRSGEVVPRRAVVVGPRFAARAELLTTLGLETAEYEMAGHVLGTFVPADPGGGTSVAGVWVAGNVADPQATVIGAAAAGLRAAAAINADLIEEETELGVAARRATAGSHSAPVAARSPVELVEAVQPSNAG